MKLSKTLIAALFSALTILSLVGCADTDEERAAKKANDLLAEYKTVSERIDKRGQADGSWTAEQITAQETDVNRLEVIVNTMESLNHYKNVEITGIHTVRASIQVHKTAIKEARAKKGLSEPEEKKKTDEDLAV